ncbi:hypothetical protein [Gordonia sp. i37]|uniref:hypothetical protein n=1 Tax=Gordonia sp. i37 TaxID=1961707 RepID=UPI0009AE9CB6|nr:hypothetical protein [Gordonia sp. i37]OPX06223.1 hypothetical protein B1964_28795 [Gordonia sp. i37]
MATQQLLATVDRLTTRLGITLEAGTADYARAETALWDASVRAVEITEQDWSGPGETVPDEVVRIVLACAQRLYRNPDRFVQNQAGTFGATLPASDFTTGDILLAAEKASLAKHKPRPGTVWTIASTREDGSVILEPEQPSAYVADGINQGLGDPFFVGNAWANGPW